MAGFQQHDALRGQASALLDGPHWRIGSAAEQDARRLLPELRRGREFRLLAQLCERLVRAHPAEPQLRTWQAQALIELGYASSAIEVAGAGLRQLPDEHHPEWSELHGLVGRAYKQIAFDTADPAGAASEWALRQALQAYALPWRRDPGNTWHAINLVAMLAHAQRIGLAAPADPDPAALATQVIATLEARPGAQRDRWTAATLAEAYLALGQPDEVERHLATYLLDPEVQAFELGSTLRQFSEVWGLRDSPDARLRGLVQVMRARLLELPGAQCGLAPQEVARQIHERRPSSAQLQAILGDTGTKSFDWWKLGLERACSVAAVYAGIGQRIGTGFLVAARDFGRGGADELLLLTNYHVINPHGAGGALRPDDAEIAFEAVDPARRHRISAVLWASPTDQHDACLMRLDGLPPGAAAIPIARHLPVIEDTARVYVVGHPGGGNLEFSFQDNALLDHEGPTAGHCAIPGVCRLHYRAPTEAGSSGSPVFNAAYWQVIALHHAGGVLPRLNARPGMHPANEGISLASIIAAATA